MPLPPPPPLLNGCRPSSYYDPQIPTDEYGVKETEPIGWLAAAMQQQNSEMPAAMEEEASFPVYLLDL